MVEIVYVYVYGIGGKNLITYIYANASHAIHTLSRYHGGQVIFIGDTGCAIYIILVPNIDAMCKYSTNADIMEIDYMVVY